MAEEEGIVFILYKQERMGESRYGVVARTRELETYFDGDGARQIDGKVMGVPIRLFDMQNVIRYMDRFYQGEKATAGGFPPVQIKTLESPICLIDVPTMSGYIHRIRPLSLDELTVVASNCEFARGCLVDSKPNVVG